jgi:hypothetical protein
MPKAHIPGQKVYNALRTSYQQSFFLDYDSSGVLVLYIKLYPYLAIAVINGAPLTLVFRNPFIAKNEITLYIHDLVDLPFHISKKFDEESSKILGLTDYIHYFDSKKEILIVIYDETFKNIFTEITSFKTCSSPSSWHDKIIANKINFNNYFWEDDYKKENDLTGYKVEINPIKFSKGFGYWNVETSQKWGEKPYILSTNKQDNLYNVANYIKDGKTGYLQEQNIKEKLSDFYVPNLQLFNSPMLKDKQELTDIVFGINGYLILLESKTTTFSCNQQSTIMSREIATTQRINKACKQLIKAEEIVTTTFGMIEDLSLFDHCLYAKRIITLCIINDATLLNQEDLSLYLIKYDRETLPIIMSLEIFYGILHKLNSSIKIAELLWHIKLELRNKEGLPILAGINYK